jgi:hypothetical protein
MEDQDYMQSLQQIKAAIDAHIQAFPNAEAIQDLLGVLMAGAYGQGKGDEFVLALLREAWNFDPKLASYLEQLKLSSNP